MVIINGAATGNWLDEELQVTCEYCILGKFKLWCRKTNITCREINRSFFHKSSNSAVKNHEAETANITWMQSVLCVPDSNAIAVEILLSWPMNFKLHMHLPVLQVTRLWSRDRTSISFYGSIFKQAKCFILYTTQFILTEYQLKVCRKETSAQQQPQTEYTLQMSLYKFISYKKYTFHFWFHLSPSSFKVHCELWTSIYCKDENIYRTHKYRKYQYETKLDVTNVSREPGWVGVASDEPVNQPKDMSFVCTLSSPQYSRWTPACFSHLEWVAHMSSSPTCFPRSPTGS